VGNAPWAARARPRAVVRHHCPAEKLQPRRQGPSVRPPIPYGATSYAALTHASQNGFHVVSVGVERERRVVSSTVRRPRPRSAIVGSSCF
jgi:hypothetical protein